MKAKIRIRLHADPRDREPVLCRYCGTSAVTHAAIQIAVFWLAVGFTLGVLLVMP